MFMLKDAKCENPFDLVVEDVETDEKVICDDGHYYTSDGDRLYTRQEVQYAINRASDDATRGYTDNLVSDYL